MNRYISHITLFGLLLIVAFLSACSSNVKKDGALAGEDVPVYSDDGVDIVDTNGNAGTASGVGAGNGLNIDPLDDPNSELFVRTIYFDYDSSEIRSDSAETVRHHGQYLATNPSVSVRLEGHADSRGTREYNLALGELRAKSVRQLMLLEGALDNQIEIISYGEERPAVAGEDEEAYQLNRRVEIVY